jgi:hypothetical protein
MRTGKAAHKFLNMWLAPQEEFVKVRTAIWPSRFTTKAPRVDDSIEGVIVVRLKENGQNRRFE